MRNQNKNLKCKRKPGKKSSKKNVKLKIKVPAISKKNNGGKKAKRVLQVVAVKKPAAKASVKVNVKVPKVNIKAGLKKAGDAMKKTGLKIKAGLKKTGAQIKAGAHKVGLKIKTGMKKAGDAMKKTGIKVKAGLKKFGDDGKKFVVKAKTAIKKAFKIKVKSPTTFMKGTICSPLFKSAWKMTMQFTRMTKTAAVMGLECFKAVALSRSNAVCAACDNTQYEKFKNGFKVGGYQLDKVTETCAPFLSWISSYFKVQAAIAKYAESTVMKSPLSNSSTSLIVEATKWDTGLAKCFNG